MLHTYIDVVYVCMYMYREREEKEFLKKYKKIWSLALLFLSPLYIMYCTYIKCHVATFFLLFLFCL